MLVGASMGEEDLADYGPKLAGNHIMRIFPEKKTISGKADVGVLPSWTDPRVVYCKNNNVVPFFSSKVDGYGAGLTHVKNQLIQMPQWLKDRPGVVLWITDRHEPEGDLAGGAEPAAANAFKANFKAFVDMLDSLPAALRAKIWVGPVLTKTWVEKANTSRDYDLYDPMALGTKYGGDFFAVDMYHETGTASAVVKPSTIISPATFVAKFRAYKFNSGDSRPRFWPELGLVGMPEDTDGSARANWIQGVHDECKKMQAGQVGWSQPWNMLGWIWWHQIGKATGQVRDVGEARDFPLHLRSKPLPAKTYTDSKGKTFWFSEPVNLPGTPPLPLAKFNQIWTAENSGVVIPDPPPPDPEPEPEPEPPPAGTSVWSWRVGATMQKSQIDEYKDRIPRNGMLRVFPNSDGLPPSWSDPRFVYCRDYDVMPVISSNIDGDSSKFAAMKQWIINMPQWLKDRPGVVLLCTDRHEPENNFPNNPSKYITNYTNWWNAVIQTLPAEVRAKVWAGPMLTRQWIEGGASKGNNNYQQYDPGPSVSDYYGVDMYHDSWEPGDSGKVATSYKAPVAFLSKFKAYRYNNSASDTRPRIFPELGAIGIPTDVDGSQRAAWLQGLVAEMDTWGPATTGWPWLGFIYWNNTDLGGGPNLDGIGTRREFYLDKRQTANNGLVDIVPPKPLEMFNLLAAQHFTVVTDPGGEPGPVGQGTAALSARTNLSAAYAGAPATQPPPPVVVPPIPGLPATGPAAGRALQAIYTVLVTTADLEVIGDPLSDWQSLQVTVRWKEPGSGQIVIPAAPYVREQLVAGCRIVVLRRVLGTQHILIAGPMEQALWEKSDGADDNAGVGKMTITFVDDLGWLGARLSYPDPDKLPEQQTSDYWLYDGNPEQAMLQLVATQAGPLALAARQVPKLQVAPYSGLSDASVQIVGTSDVTPRERLEKVTDVLRKICTLGANSMIPGSPDYHPDSLGFRVRQTSLAGDAVLLFEPLRSRDLAGEVHFSFGKGNLKYFSYEIAAPSMTHAVVGGSGDGIDRFVREIATLEPASLQWGRFEGYVSTPGSDPLETMQQAAEQAFAETRASARLASNAADTPDQRYGVHYNAGDIVSVELAPGQYESAPVQTVALQAFPTTGEVVGITIGDQSARYDSPFIQRFRELDRRLGRIERRGSA